MLENITYTIEKISVYDTSRCFNDKLYYTWWFFFFFCKGRIPKVPRQCLNYPQGNYIMITITEKKK